MEFWKDFEIEIDNVYTWHIGSLTLWVRLTSHEWWIGTEEGEDDGTAYFCQQVPEEPDDLNWKRWARVNDGRMIQFRPVLPDKPVVVRPETPVFFPEGAVGMLYARIPVWIEIKVGDLGDGVTLCEVPSCTLSNTWFGENTVEGELCYGMKTRARRTLEGIEPNAGRVVCPLDLHNRSEDALDFQRLCVESSHLSVYEYEGQLWTSRVGITYRGDERLSAVKYEENWFEQPEKALLLSPPKTPPSGGKFKKSFVGFMNFARGG